MSDRGVGIAVLASTSRAFLVRGLSPTSTYSFAVVPVVRGHLRFVDASNLVATTPPPAVTSLKVVGTTASTVGLSWIIASSLKVAGVMIRRLAGAAAPATPWAGQLVAKLGSKARSFTDADLTPGKTFSYSVYTFNGGYEESAASTVRATTRSGKTTTIRACGTKDSITSSQTWSPSKATSYGVGCILTIESGATLTIDAGAVVKLSGSGMILAASGGRLIVGGASRPVIFTSYRDGEVGGASGAGVPVNGDYMAAVELQAGASVTITNAVFLYGNAGVADNFYTNGCGSPGAEDLSVTDSIFDAQVAIGNCSNPTHARFTFEGDDFEMPTFYYTAFTYTTSPIDSTSIQSNWFDTQGTTGVVRELFTEQPTGISLGGATTNTFAPGSGTTLVYVVGTIPKGTTYPIDLPARVQLIGSSLLVQGTVSIGAGTTIGNQQYGAMGLAVEATGALLLEGTATEPVHMAYQSTLEVFGSGTLDVVHTVFSGDITSSAAVVIVETSCVAGAEHVLIEHSTIDAGIQLGQCAVAHSETLDIVGNVIERPSGSAYLRLTSQVADPGVLTISANRLVATSTIAPSLQPAIWVDQWPVQGIDLAGSATNHFASPGTNRVIELASCTVPAKQTWTVAPASGVVVAPWSGAGYGPGLLVTGRLLLEPGTVVKTVAGTGIQVEPNGTLDAAGSGAARVTFTSIEDSSIDGSSDPTGPSVGIPAGKGGNYGIAVQANEDAFLNVTFAMFRDGLWAIDPAYDVTPAVRGDATISHTIFEEELQLGDYNGSQVGYLPVLTNDVWAFNGAPSGQFAAGGGEYDPAALQAAVYLSNIDPVGFSLAGATSNTFTGSGAGRVVVLDGTTIPKGASWTVNPASHVVLAPFGDYDYLKSASITVNGQLILDRGTVVKDQTPYAGILVGASGTLRMSRAVFTAIDDDTIDGDSNGDGALSKPVAGVYGTAIQFDDVRRQGTVSTDRFTYASTAVDSPSGGDVTISADTFTKNQTAVSVVAGISTSASVSNDIFAGNTISIASYSTWLPVSADPFDCQFVPQITASKNSYAGGSKPLVTTSDYAAIEAAMAAPDVKDSPDGWTKDIAPGNTDDLTGWLPLPCVDVAKPSDSYPAVAIPLDFGG